MNRFKASYWDDRYVEHNTGWDVGHPTTPFIEFEKSLDDKSIKILIPGCGHAYEGEYFYNAGFKDITLLDYSTHARADFLQRVPEFPEEKYQIGDFFAHNDEYDLILEQTFFCALEPSLRDAYAKKMHQLLKDDGMLVGVLFQFPLTTQGPPFGGSIAEYKRHFSPLFTIEKLEECHNSIAPRMGNEVFIRLRKSRK
jgi:hypothetical protein